MVLRIENCGKGRILDPIKNKCIHVNRLKKNNRGKKIAEFLEQALEQWKAAQPEEKWKKKPGERNFNKYVFKKMKREKLQLTLKCNSKSFAYQDTVSFCLHPSTTINRLLVVHRTGSGKTRTMIKVLDNYFYDPRPKIIIFPTQETTNNFYLQLMSFENQYSNIVLNKYPNIIKHLNTRTTYNESLKKVKNLLAMTGELNKFKQGLNQMAPLRAYRYSVAGGNSIFKGNKPNDPIFKLNFTERGHEYSNKIILMDEIHNLISPGMNLAKYRPKLITLKNALFRAKNSVLGGFTATPIVEGLEKGKELLNIIKGTTKGNNEGYISYFNDLPRTIYPKIKITKMYIPIQKESNDRSIIKKTEKPNSNFEAYAKAYKHRPKKSEIKNVESQILKMCNFINMGAYYTQVRLWYENFEQNPEKWASKMYHVIKDIEKHKQKSLILIHRRAGFKGLVKAFELISSSNLFPNCDFSCFSKAYDKNDSKNIKEFSKTNNLKGEKIKIFIADSSQFGEGVSFLGVRQLYLFNPSLNYSEYLQLRGRTIRACSSHHSLPPKQRKVNINICIGKIPKFKSIDSFLMKKLEKEEKKYKKQMSFFKTLAVDRKILQSLL